MDFRTAASIALVGDAARVAALGTNTDIDTLTQPEDVWSGSSLGVLNGIDHKLVQIPQTAVATEVVSDNVNDTAAGTGLRTMLVGYLDTNYDAKTTTITLNGTTPVAMPENIRAVNTMVRVTAGTFRGSNIGNISLRATGGAGATYSYMESGFGFARSSLYTVPNGFTLLLFSELFAINQVDTTARQGVFSVPIMNSTGAVAKALELGISSTTPYRHEADGLPINTVAQKNSTWITCEAVNNNNTSVTAGFVGFIIRNTRLVVDT